MNVADIESLEKKIKEAKELKRQLEQFEDFLRLLNTGAYRMGRIQLFDSEANELASALFSPGDTGDLISAIGRFVVNRQRQAAEDLERL